MANKIPHISVIIPAYNAEATIEACIFSVLNQTIQMHEIIIINDGSTDGTEKKVQHIIENNPRITIRQLVTKNGGVSKARNIGIVNSNSDYIAFLDSDDTWLPEKMEKQITVFESHPSAVLVSSASTLQKKLSHRILQITLKKLLIKNYIVTSSVLIKKTVIEKILFNENLKRSEDYNAWLKIAKQYEIYMIDELLVQYADKLGYGVSGLSKNIHAFEKAELANFFNLYTGKYISFYQYTTASLFSMLKYIRRVLIISFKKGKK